MPQPARLAPPDSSSQAAGRFIKAASELRSVLRPAEEEPERDLFERLREHEELLNRHWPEGQPSGEAEPHFDRALRRRERKLDRQLLSETADDIVSLLLKLVWLALGLILIWERLTG